MKLYVLAVPFEITCPLLAVTVQTYVNVSTLLASATVLVSEISVPSGDVAGAPTIVPTGATLFTVT